MGSEDETPAAGPVLDEYEVVIVGARVAGASTGLLLARQGLRVLVLDRSDPNADTLSTHALTRGGVIQLERWDLLGELIARGTPPIRSTTFHYANEVVALDLEARYGVDALYAPRRTVLDPLIVGAARDAGADVRYGAMVTSLLRGNTGRVAGVEFVERATGDAIQVRSVITVGADGVRSLVARDTAAATSWSGSGAGAMVYGYFPNPGVDGYHWLYRPNATAGVIPTNHDQVCVWVGTSASRFMSDLRGDLQTAFQRLVTDAAPEFANVFDPTLAEGRLRGYAGQPGYLRHSWGDGWALVGDAGYFKDPLTAHGITDALRDAELLARAIVERHHGDDAHEALARYQQHRDLLSTDLAEVTDQIASYHWDMTEIKALIRQQGRCLADEARLLAATL